MRATVRAVTDDGRARVVRFSFTKTLSDPSLVFLAWGVDGLEPFAVPRRRCRGEGAGGSSLHAGTPPAAPASSSDRGERGFGGPVRAYALASPAIEDLVRHRARSRARSASASVATPRFGSTSWRSVAITFSAASRSVWRSVASASGASRGGRASRFRSHAHGLEKSHASQTTPHASTSPRASRRRMTYPVVSHGRSAPVVGGFSFVKLEEPTELHVSSSKSSPNSS